MSRNSSTLKQHINGMLRQLLLRTHHCATYLESLFSYPVSQPNQFFALLSLLHLHFDFIMLSKGNIINSEIRHKKVTARAKLKQRENTVWWDEENGSVKDVGRNCGLTVQLNIHPVACDVLNEETKLVPQIHVQKLNRLYILNKVVLFIWYYSMFSRPSIIQFSVFGN
jgi:hypothetical protein